MKQQLDTKRKNELRLKQDNSTTAEQLLAITQAYEIVKAASHALQNRILIKRSTDSYDLIRKSVFEFLLQLDANEVSIAFSKDNVEVLDMVFNSLRDDDF